MVIRWLMMVIRWLMMVIRWLMMVIRWLMMVIRWLIMVIRWLMMVIRWLMMVIRWLMMVIRWLMMVIRWLMMVIRWLMMVIRWLMMVIRWLMMVIRWLMMVIRWLMMVIRWLMMVNNLDMFDYQGISHTYLVGGVPTPLKNMSSSVGMMTFPTEWKNKTCSKPSTSIFMFSSTNWLSTQKTCGILILVINDGGGNQCYWVDKVTRTPCFLCYEVNMR